MNRTIYKYPLRVEDEVTLRLPEPAQVLSVQVQHGQPCVWAIVDPTPGAPLVERRFRVIGTGHYLEWPTGTFLATIQMHGGALVFHVFDTTPLAGEGPTP